MPDQKVPSRAGAWADRASRRHEVWFYKRLTPNDTGKTGGHQSGFVIPKPIARRLFPDLVAGGRNPSQALPFVLASHSWSCPEARATHWNQKTRDEYQVTGLGGRGCPLQQPVNTGRLLVLGLSSDGEESSAWLA